MSIHTNPAQQMSVGSTLHEPPVCDRDCSSLYVGMGGTRQHSMAPHMLATNGHLILCMDTCPQQNVKSCIDKVWVTSFCSLEDYLIMTHCPATSASLLRSNAGLSDGGEADGMPLVWSGGGGCGSATGRSLVDGDTWAECALEEVGVVCAFFLLPGAGLRGEGADGVGRVATARAEAPPLQTLCASEVVSSCCCGAKNAITLAVSIEMAMASSSGSPVDVCSKHSANVAVSMTL